MIPEVLITDSVYMPRQQSNIRPNRLKRTLVEIAVLCAMALSATAFAAGLYLQGGFGPVSSLIAGVTLFLIMICAQAAFAGSQRVAHAVARLDEIEAAAQDAPGSSGTGENIAQLSEKIEQFDTMAEHIDQLNVEISRLRRDHSDIEPSRIRRLTAEVDRIDARQDALRAQLQIESRERYEELRAELQMIETLVKQLAENVANSQRAAIASRPRQVLPAPENSELTQPEPEDSDLADPAGDDVPQAPDEQEMQETAEEVSQLQVTVSEDEKEQEPATLEPPIEELPMLDEMRQSIESNRIELFLQPVMTLPQRRVRYYEAFTRLRNESGDLMLPKDYISLAESAGIMSVIDNVMLYRSVQVLRRLEKRSSARGMFCNISAHSLLDPEFFPEFISFMEQNQTLSESMYFEFSQPMIEQCGMAEEESLSALSSLGFRFSLDQVANLDLDFQAMQEQGFRFIKIDADVLLRGMSEANAQIHAADIRSYLLRFGIALIVTKIEDERDLASVMDFNAKLGQGFVFSEPRPIRPELFRTGDEAAA